MYTKDYFIGLDLGTGSVGWAVTDVNYKLLKVNRKYTWGSRLFDSSEGAEERRLHRCARRRNRRVKERIQLLQEIFEPEIQKIDEGFFLRLQESRYYPQDKKNQSGIQPELPYSLFVDHEYTDVEYHKEFPTIYHLRKALMTETRGFDVRLLYLAIAHILHNRGHFLANMGTTDTKLNFHDIFINLLESWNVHQENQVILSEDDLIQIEKIIRSQELTMTQKKQELLKVYSGTDKSFKELLALIVGGKVSLAKLFNEIDYNSLEENKICFGDTEYDAKEEFYANNVPVHFEVILSAKVIYDWMILTDILKNDDSGFISIAKVKDYEKHQKDLHILKQAVRKECNLSEKETKLLYNSVFRIPNGKDCNYSAYVGMTSFQGCKRVIEVKKCKKKDFCEFIIKKVLPYILEGESKSYIEKEIARGSFMPKVRTTDNSVIPYQLHKKELVKILHNAETYLPFLLEKDQTGISNSEKILQLLTFRIPYYIGPLNPKHDFSWVVRKETGKVTPWNFEQKVNVEESAEKFIQRMTSKCTYLKMENVLPKSSLLYEKFMVLNEINNLKINSEPISIELKKSIFHDLYEHKERVTIKKLLDYLKREKGYDNLTKESITGIDGEFKAALKSYHAFKRVFTANHPLNIEMEDMIKDMTLFGAEPNLLKQRLVKKYPQYEKQLIALNKLLKCKEWGRLSYELLSGIAIDVPGEGNVGTIIYQLWNTNNNLMQIIQMSNSPYLRLIEERNKVYEEKKFTYSLVNDLYVSPATKCQIWQAIKIMKEILHIMGHAPKRVFVEMAREHVNEGRSITRKQNLIDLYKNIKDESEMYEELKNTDNDKLRNDRLFLYYTQLGTCAYTGERIKIEDFTNKNLYDIDHIYPRSKTADDSLDNRVLVYKPSNEDKEDKYPINQKIQSDMRSIWDMWYKKGLISGEKYHRLTRTTELTNEELCGFVNRQLVETRQSTKAFMEVMKSILPSETEFVYSKASNVARFRQEFKLLKLREMNDLHHAKDAYLNIVVGNVYHLKFTKDVRKYFESNGTNRSYNLTRMFDYDVIYKDEIAWNKKTSLKTVRDMLSSNKVLVTKQMYEKRGALFKEQPLKKGKGQIPLKIADERLTDISKYGGYDKATISYFSLIEGLNKKGKKERYLAPVPLYLSSQYDNEHMAKELFQNEFMITDVRIIHHKVLIKSLMVYDGFRMWLGGKSGDSILFHNANQLCLNDNNSKTLKEVVKFMQDQKLKPNAEMNHNNKITSLELTDLYDEFHQKLRSSIYKCQLEKFGTVLEKGRNIFIQMNREEQSKQLFEILKLFQCTPEMPNLFDLGGQKTPGAIRISMNVTKREGLAIVHQSVTGIYEKIERINE